MNFIKKNFIILILLIMVLLPVLSFASGADGDLSGVTTKIINPINVNTLTGLIKIILTGVIKIGIPIVALALIYSGFLFVSAQGNSEKLKTAKNALIYTLVGAAILLGSWAIAQIISETVLAL